MLILDHMHIISPFEIFTDASNMKDTFTYLSISFEFSSPLFKFLVQISRYRLPIMHKHERLVDYSGSYGPIRNYLPDPEQGPELAFCVLDPETF